MGDADTATIQKLIKKVIETTRCSPAQAELALYDNDNNVSAAVEYILDQGANIEAWTEQKSKKDKKKDEEERKIPRGQQSSRGRGATVADRGGRGRGGSTSTPRGGSISTTRGGGVSRGGRGQSSTGKLHNPGKPQPDHGVLRNVDLNEESSDWKGGNLEFKRSEPVTAAVPSGSSTNSNTTPHVPNTSAPISFAAVAAAGAKKEQQKNQPPQQVPKPAKVTEPLRESTPEPTPVEAASKEQDSFTSEPSVAHPKVEPEEVSVPVSHEEPVSVASVHTIQATSPQLQANATWTSQLKNDLGIGVPIATDVSPVKPQFATPASLPGVEFASEAVSTGLIDYHFGFVEAPPVVTAPPVEPTHAPESLFTNTRHSSATVAPLKPSPEIHSTMGNGEYPIRTSSPTASNNTLSQSRLGFADASTVSYNPTSTTVETRTQNVSKPLGHMAPTQPQAHQPQQQQPMFPSQMPFASYPNPYMNIPNMYSPVTAGIRPDDYAALLQYPFSVPGMDMTNLMGGGAFPQSSSSQSLSTQHRSDNHGIENTMKFSTQSNRDQSQQPSAVQPPPGFGTSHFGMQPQINMLQQHYTPHNYAQFMMPNIGNAGGRQIYSQDEERKSYDKMSGVKAQPTQPQAYHTNGHYGMGGGTANKKYNWNS